MGFSRHMIDFRINNTRYMDVMGTLKDTGHGSPSRFHVATIGTSLLNVYRSEKMPVFNGQEWPAQAFQWVDRCRRNGWPPESTVTAIVNSGCYIVPKGFKGIPSEHMEWSIAFAVHEKSIVQLFNLTQKHVYILLKIIAKDLKENVPHLQDLLTSYTMKTVALWQVELHHKRNWDRSHLLDRLMEALYFLKSCVENQNAQAYFIMENNLSDGKINVFKAERFARLLNDSLS
ncbi:hypothetical protein CHS0354_035482 [Potamilus streckersoni]|uniref:Mab-21-like HhH/H2TH-like domain-containing protein n=1 Tax=Potamilus streckersoni TaxID=2493646 RepID=A0AAE0VKV7_9BIVA|nr:hypothetical protein CHS0354_035482 [Potamilus streckersoni]